MLKGVVLSVLCFLLTKGRLPVLQRDFFCHEAILPLSYNIGSLSDPTKGEPCCHQDAGSLSYRGKLLAMRLHFPFLIIWTPCQLPSDESVITIHNHLLWAVALVASEEIYCTECT